MYFAPIFILGVLLGLIVRSFYHMDTPEELRERRKRWREIFWETYNKGVREGKWVQRKYFETTPGVIDEINEKAYAEWHEKHPKYKYLNPYAAYDNPWADI